MDTPATNDAYDPQRPLWKRASYWLLIVIIALVALLTWYTARKICEPAPISFECFEWPED